MHARDFKSWSSPGIPWTCHCFSFCCCCCFFPNHGFLPGFSVLLHLLLVPSESNWEAVNIVLISCLEGIWIFNHYHYPLSSLFYCIYVVLLVWLMFLWSDGKEGPNLKDFIVYLWDKQHLSHSTAWELMGSTGIMKPEEKEASFRAYFPLNLLSVYWLALPCNKKCLLVCLVRCEIGSRNVERQTTNSKAKKTPDRLHALKFNSGWQSGPPACCWSYSPLDL